MSKKAENKRTRPIKDIAIVVIVTLVGSILLVTIDAFDRFYVLTRAWEQWEIDEVIPIFVVLFLSLSWFSYRRWKESLAEIDKRKQETGTVRDSEERFRTLFEYAPDAYYLNDLKGIFIDGNRGAEELIGYKREEFIGKRFTKMDLLSPQQIPKALAALARNVVGLPSGPEEFILKRKDGRRVSVEIRTYPVKIQGEVLVLGIARDITERKRVEGELKKLSVAIEQSPVSIVITDPEGSIEYVNPKFCELTGYSAEEVMGKNSRILQSGEMPEEGYQQLWQTILAGKEWRGEFHNKKKNGALFWEDASISAILNDHGDIAHFIAVKEDVTERKRAEKELIRAKEEAEEMNRLKSAFLANMSHEIRTPLAGILGFTQLLVNEVPEPQREYIEHINRSGQRLLQMLNSVLDLSMLSVGGLRLNREVCDLGDEVGQAVELLQPLAQEKGLSLRREGPVSPVEALLDRACLSRILDNLIDNALKFTKHGEVVVEVRALAERVEIAVRDTGIGIAEEFMPYLFEALNQESTGLARTHEGAGLGLAITKQLAELMGGQIAVESRKGAGSTFTVSFPRLPAAQLVTTEAKAAVRPLVARRPMQVLTVDDNPAMLHLVERFLEGVREVVGVEGAQDDETALRLARQQRFDVVLMDINLGGARTGEDVLKALREMPEYKDVPVVAVTAYALPGDRERFLKAGFDAYLGKPFTQEHLSNVLMQVATPS